MKNFTKIILIIAGVMAAIGTICIVIAFCMGLNWGVFRNMVLDGKFTFSIGEDFVWELRGDRDVATSDDTITFTEEITKLEIEYGAGELEICYGDVEGILVEPQAVVGFATEVDNGTLSIEGGLGINNNENSSLKITLPQGMTLEEVDLEIGASSAIVADLVVDSMVVEVGAGEATIEQLDVNTLDVEVGVGELTIELAGEREDYSYNVDCGIGSIKIGDNSYGGLGTSHNVENPGATRHMIIECGVGEIEINFMK